MADWLKLLEREEQGSHGREPIGKWNQGFRGGEAVKPVSPGVSMPVL